MREESEEEEAQVIIPSPCLQGTEGFARISGIDASKCTLSHLRLLAELCRGCGQGLRRQSLTTRCEMRKASWMRFRC